MVSFSMNVRSHARMPKFKLRHATTRRALHAGPRSVYFARRMSKGPPPDVLIVAPSWVGDAVMSQCLILALRANSPEVPIDVLAADSVAPVYRRMPEVRAVVRSPFRHKEFGLLGRVRLGRALAGRYHRAYVLPGSWKSALVPFAAGVERRCGYLRRSALGPSQ